MLSHFLALPLFLMMHNPVDFSVNGACPQYVNRLNCTVTQYVEILEAHNNLKLVNKTATLDSRIHALGLQFESYDTYHLQDARTMMIGLIDSFLDAINRSQCLRPYLCHFPFTPNDIEMRVNFVDNCKYAYPGFDEIKSMSFINGVITYSVANPCGGLIRYREEGLDLARGATPSLLQFIPPKCRDPRWKLD